MVNLNLDNKKYKEKGKELGLPFEEPKLKPSSNQLQEQGGTLLRHGWRKEGGRLKKWDEK